MGCLSSKTVKTRKSHRCWGCTKEYPPGTVMTVVNWVDGGTVSSDYWCAVCDEYIRRYMRCEDEFGYGEIYDNDPEGWGELERELRQGGNNQCD